MCVVILYWLTVILGALDIDLIPGGDADVDLDIDGAEGPSWFMSLLGGPVPATVVFTAVIFKGWAISLLVHWYFGATIASFLGPVLFVLLLTTISFLTAVWLSTLTLKPMRTLFDNSTIRGGRHLIGKMVTVTSSRVNTEFGMAEYAHDDAKTAPILLNVITDQADLLSNGMEAIITDFDDDKNTYFIKPMQLETAKPTLLEES